MEEKINIAKLLKDCPKGMELDCTMFENVTFVRVYMSRKQFPIEIAINGKLSKYLTKEGCFHDVTLLPDAKCVIFPIGKTTWEGFVPPYKFKDGDVCYVKTKTLFEYIFIVKVSKNYVCTENYVALSAYELYTDISSVCATDSIKEIRLATEEEKQKLFDAIKANGYVWNAETKTLEKLIEPKFKVGDRIVKRNSINNSCIVSSVSSEYYGLKLPEGVEGIGVLPVSEQDDYELLLNTDKFDITTLKPFDKVLIRDSDTQKWSASLFSYCDGLKSYKYTCINGSGFKQCIPYEGNEHLLGTTNDCSEYYKTW